MELHHINLILGIWLRMLDSNQRTSPYEGDEITTSTNPQNMADEDRLELSNTGAKNQWVYQFLHSSILVEEVGFEPTKDCFIIKIFLFPCINTLLNWCFNKHHTNSINAVYSNLPYFCVIVRFTFLPIQLVYSIRIRLILFLILSVCYLLK